MARVVPIESALPSLDALSATLRRYAGDCPPDRLPALVGALEAVKALAWARLFADQQCREQHPAAAAPANLLDAKTMARNLNVKESWLRDAARKGRVPCVHVGRYVRFDPAQVLRAVMVEDPR